MPDNRPNIVFILGTCRRGDFVDVFFHVSVPRNRVHVHSAGTAFCPLGGRLSD
jgi:hypothetical protein